MKKILDEIALTFVRIERTIQTIINYVIDLVFQPVYYLIELVGLIYDLWTTEEENNEENKSKQIGFNQ